MRENDPATWPVVISIHGIRTTGRWQKELNDVLTSAGFRHVPLDFGFFSALSLLMPWSRSRKVEWFHRTYSEKFAGGGRKPSVIAHSFGSYIVTRAMLKYDDIRFERVILCGSIVSRSYPWRAVLLARDQADAVLNEAGGRDMWAAMVEWVVSDAGASGVSGFEDTAEGRLVQLIHERHAHSDYFYRQNYERRWLPFLQGRPVQPVMPAGGGRMNRKFLFTICMLIALIVIAAWLGAGDRGAERFAGFAARFSTGSPAPAKIQTATIRAAQAGASQKPPPSTPPNESAPLAVDSDVVALREQFEHLRGEWVQAGDLPQSIEDGVVGRCVKDRNARTILVFERIDEMEGTVLATWRQHAVVMNRFSFRKSGPQPYYEAIRERKECLGKLGSDAARRILEETGRLSVDPSSVRDQPAKATLMVEGCTLDGEDCPTAMFGNRQEAPLETIGEARLRMGSLLFIRQAGGE